LQGVGRLELPCDHPRSGAISHRGGAIYFDLDTDLTQRLRDLSRMESATLFMTLVTAFQLLLSQQTGQDDIPVGTPIANRHNLETEHLIGFFVNTIVLRAKIDTTKTFRELLACGRQILLDAYAHQDVPFEKLVEQLSPQRELGQTAFFQTWFYLHSFATGPSPHLGTLEVESLTANSPPAKVEFALIMEERSQTIHGSFIYAAELFEKQSIETLCQHFYSLLNWITCNPTIPCAELAVPKASLEHSVEPGFKF
jgi:non-ribosomal peptide synthetase component F